MVLKAIAIFMDIVLFGMVLYFMSGTKDKSAKVGFSIMEIAYVLSIIGLIYG